MATGTVLVVTVATKFTHGAWIVVAGDPGDHVRSALREPSLRAHPGQVRKWLVKPRPDSDNHVLLLVPDASPAVAEALGWVRSVRPRDATAIYVPRGEPDPEFRRRWNELTRASGPELEELPAEGGSVLDRIRERIRSSDRAEGDFTTVVVPEMIDKPGMAYLVGHRDLIRLKGGLLGEPRVVVTDVPVQMEGGLPVGVDSLPLVPQRTVALVFVAAVTDAVTRAVNYARSLNATETRAVFFAFDPEGRPADPGGVGGPEAGHPARRRRGAVPRSRGADAGRGPPVHGPSRTPWCP